MLRLLRLFLPLCLFALWGIPAQAQDGPNVSADAYTKDQITTGSECTGNGNSPECECSFLGLLPMAKLDGSLPTGETNITGSIGGDAVSIDITATNTTEKEEAGHWESDKKVSAVMIKGGQEYTVFEYSPDSYFTDEFENLTDKGFSHMTFCGLASADCENSTFVETLGKDGSVGYVDLEIMNVDGLQKVTFPTLVNLNLSSASPGWTLNGPTMIEYTGGGALPTMVTVRLFQADPSNRTSRYFAVTTSDCDGGFEFELDPPITFDRVTPDAFSLDSAYPNPFNPETTIRFTLPEEAGATLSIYDVTGRLVKTLVTSTLEAGTHSVRWNGTDESGQSVASGLYLYRLEAGAFTQTRSMLLLK